MDVEAKVEPIAHLSLGAVPTPGQPAPMPMQQPPVAGMPPPLKAEPGVPAPPPPQPAAAMAAAAAAAAAASGAATTTCFPMQPLNGQVQPVPSSLALSQVPQQSAPGNSLDTVMSIC